MGSMGYDVLVAMKERKEVDKGGWKEVERGEEDVVMSIEGWGEWMRDMGGISRFSAM